eukprot:4405896-Amphidinium_carterae.3
MVRKLVISCEAFTTLVAYELQRGVRTTHSQGKRPILDGKCRVVVVELLDELEIGSGAMGESSSDVSLPIRAAQDGMLDISGKGGGGGGWKELEAGPLRTEATKSRD